MTHGRSEQRLLLADPNLRIIFLITLMAVMGVANLTPAFPVIARELHVPKSSIGLLIMVFTFPGIILTPVLGVLADRLGRKKVLTPSLLLFGLAGGACMFARDFHLLLLFRFIQGIGAAALGSINVTLIGDLFTGKKRAAAMGFNASVLSIATAFYPFIGGFLTTFGWRYAFAMQLTAVPVGLVVMFFLKNPEPVRKQQLGDYLRSAFISLKNRTALIYLAASLVVFIVLYGSYLTYLPILLSEKFSATPMQIGMVLSSMSIITAITSSQAGRLNRWVSESSLLGFSFLLYAAALCTLPFIQKLWMFPIAISIYGIGQGINMPSLQTLLAGLAPLEYRAAFMSMNGMVLRLGQTLGPLITGAVFIAGGITAPFFSGAVLSLLMFAVLMAWGRPSTRA